MSIASFLLYPVEAPVSRVLAVLARLFFEGYGALLEPIEPFLNLHCALLTYVLASASHISIF